MLDPRIPIVGRENTGTHPRLSIQDLQTKEPFQFVLFILSYLILQQRDLEPQVNQEETSKQKAIIEAYYTVLVRPPQPAALIFPEIAGIHGLPYQQWTGDPDHDTKADYDENDPKDMGPMPSRFGGYCNHGSVLFPSWHRPYVMAIEQAIGDVAEVLATLLEASGAFPKGTWPPAANDLRFPWWDWAEKTVADVGLPTVLSDDQVTLVLDQSPPAQITITNPLSFYLLKSIPKGFKNVTDPKTKMTAYFSKWMRTVRYASSSPDDPHSNIPELNKTLKQQAECVRSRVASLFTLPPTSSPPTSAYRVYDEFSNHTVQSTNNLHYYTSDSLEGVHDSMHDILGGNGHMSDPDYAGFDPIFYLHHCNVDRLYALWEYVYPKECYIGKWKNIDERVYPFTQNCGTYSLVYNSELLGQTKLAPFRRKDGEYWTTDDAREFLKGSFPKYYKYPLAVGEIDVTKPVTPEEQARYRKLLQDYYSIDDSFTTLPAPLTSFMKPAAQDGGLARLPHTVRIVIGVQTPEFAFSGPYSIQVIYTDKNKKPNHLGAINIFARQPESNCEACEAKRQMGTNIHGILPVPSKIIQDVVDVIGPAVKPAAPEALVDELKRRLSATILDRFKRPVADAKATDQMHWDNSNALAPHVTPTITVASSYVARFGGGKERDRPVQWDSWTDHGEVFRPHLDKTGWRTL